MLFTKESSNFSFTLETYNSIMSKAFNDLELVGAVHALSERGRSLNSSRALRSKMLLVGLSQLRMHGITPLLVIRLLTVTTMSSLST